MTVSRKNDTKIYRFHDGESLLGDHVYLGLFVRTISPQIGLLSLCRNTQKIAQRKDARIRVLLKDGFCHVFPDVAKGALDHYFHVGEQ